ncbi:MAG: alpha/beta hydrolase [Thermoflexales bacterium]|nr:alpha/beta hydrolase [Thermoflexales bacterium]
MRRNTWRIAGALAATALALVYARYRRDTRAAAARLRTGSQIVETSHGQVEYALAGQGPPVLVVHGGGGGYDQGLLLARFLGLGSRFRCIAVSRFGYLRSPLPADASPAAQADAYAALLDALELERVAVVGGSAGGPSSLHFALRHPQRCAALVLVSALSRAWTWPTMPPIVQDLMLHSGFLFWAVVNFAPQALLSAFGLSPRAVAGAGKAEKARLVEILQTILPIRLRWAGLANDANQMAVLAPCPLERITVPTLVLHALDDGLAPFAHGQAAAEAIPGARLLRLDSGGHLWLGQQETMVSAVRDFMNF